MDRNEAIKVIKDNLPEGRYQLSEALKTLIPELKESEDEGIRRAIIKSINDLNTKWLELHGVTKEEALAWLEKQGGQKQNVTDIISDLENYFATTTKEQQEKDWDEIKNWEEKHFNHDRHIKINPADKIEPKFKVGDWVVWNDHIICHIDNIYKENTLMYTINTNGVTWTDSVKKFDAIAHLWTIQDAKDGDVLSFNDGHGNDCIELIKSITDLNKDKKIEFWFCLTNDEIYEVFDGICPYTNMTSRQNAAPATKEQRDKLEKAITEAGYEWDGNKKELKKINLNKAEHGKYYFCIKDYFSGGKKFASKCDVIQALRGLPIMGLEDISEYFIPVKNVQNPAWSEEDEKILKGIIDDIQSRLECYPIEQLADIYSKEISWLKSLKERYTWKPSNEQMEALLKLEEMHVLEHEKNQENAHLYMVIKSLKEQLFKLKGK